MQTIKNHKSLFSLLLKTYAAIFLLVGMVALLAVTSCAPLEVADSGTDTNEPDSTDSNQSNADWLAQSNTEWTTSNDAWIEQSNTDWLAQSNTDWLAQSNTDWLAQSNTDWLAQSNTDWLAKSNTDWINSFTVADVSKENCEHADLSLNCFISVWYTANSGNGASDSTKIVLPLVNNGEYNFYVDWGDGEDVEKIEAYNADKITHTYNGEGKKTIHIAGTIKGWRFYAAENSYGDAVKLLDVSQWGSLSLGNTDGRQFRGAENFRPTATDAPDVSETTSLVSAFNSASNFNADISDWNVSKVTTMNYMFLNASRFNNKGKPLDWGTKTSKVTSMYSMFSGASVFNQDIRNWDVSQVTDMRSMFLNARDFNQNISGWNVSQVTDMRSMFLNARDFNQNISGWNVCNVAVANSANFDDGASATWTQKPNWGMDCPTN